MPKIGTKNVLFGCFGPKYGIFTYVRDRVLKTLLSYLKSTPSNFSNYNIFQKNKNAKVCDQTSHFRIYLTENVLFRNFQARILRMLLSDF